MKIISTHSHLLTEPEDLDFFLENGKISQFWLLGLPAEIRIPGYSHPATEEELLSVAKRYPGFYLPFKWIDFNQSPDQIDKAVEQGYAGFKCIYPKKPYNDDSYFPFFERIARYRYPVVFHTGYVSTPLYAECSPRLGYQSENMHPSALYTLSIMFPEINFVAAHFGIPWENELLDRSIRQTPNIYVDLSGGHTDEIFNIVEKCAALPATLSENKTGVFADKFLVGFDAYLGHPQLHRDIMNSLEDFEHRFQQLRGDACFWNEHIPGIFAENAVRVLQHK